MSASLVPVAWAQDKLGLKAAEGVGLPGDLPGRILAIVNGVLIVVAVVALAFIVYGGFRYVVSRGDEQDVATAKNTLIYAVVGLVVIGLAAALVNFVVDAILGR